MAAVSLGVQITLVLFILYPLSIGFIGYFIGRYVVKHEQKKKG